MSEETRMTLVISDEEDIRRAVKALDMMSVLWELTEYLRSEIKYNQKEYDKVLETLNNLMYDKGISFNELYR